MWDEWCTDDLYAFDAAVCSPPFENPYTCYAGAAPPVDQDDGFSLDDVWGFAVPALAGIVAYEGVRRFLARNRHQEDEPAASISSDATRSASAELVAPPDSAPDSVGAMIPDPHPRPEAGPETSPRIEHPGDNAAELVDELISLYDLETSDALRRRIVRSLAKVGVRIDDTAAIVFDSEQHDVMGTIPAEPGVTPGTVVEVVRPGFVRDDGQVVRATEVVVAADADGAW